MPDDLDLRIAELMTEVRADFRKMIEQEESLLIVAATLGEMARGAAPKADLRDAAHRLNEARLVCRTIRNDMLDAAVRVEVAAGAPLPPLRTRLRPAVCCDHPPMPGVTGMDPAIEPMGEEA